MAGVTVAVRPLVTAVPTVRLVVTEPGPANTAAVPACPLVQPTAPPGPSRPTLLLVLPVAAVPDSVTAGRQTHTASVQTEEPGRPAERLSVAAVRLVTAVRAVQLAVTHPAGRHTSPVSQTAELVGRTGRTVGLVTPVRAVNHSVTPPGGRNTEPAVTSPAVTVLLLVTTTTTRTWEGVVVENRRTGGCAVLLLSAVPHHGLHCQPVGDVWCEAGHLSGRTISRENLLFYLRDFT